MGRTKRPYRRGDDLVFMGIVLLVLAVIAGLAEPILFPGNGMIVPYVLGIGTGSVFCIIAGNVMRK